MIKCFQWSYTEGFWNRGHHIKICHLINFLNVLTPEEAWQSIEKVNQTVFSPGDKLQILQIDHIVTRSGPQLVIRGIGLYVTIDLNIQIWPNGIFGSNVLLRTCGCSLFCQVSLKSQKLLFYLFYSLLQLGIWQSLELQVAPITNIHVSDKGHFGICRMSAAEFHKPALGYVVENRAIGVVLEQCFRHNQIIKLMQQIVKVNLLVVSHLIHFNTCYKQENDVMQRQAASSLL